MSGHNGHHKKERGAKKQDIILMAMTFIVGIFAGSYLYVIGFAPQFDSMQGQTEEAYDDFVLEATQYGITDKAGTLPSFQILKTGTFRYLPQVASGSTAEAKEGTLPRTLLKEVKSTLSGDVLADASENVVKNGCPSETSGIDYRYSISLDSEIFELDSCTTMFDVNSSTGLVMNKLWSYFENLK